jgi:hypothetical protein
MQTMPGAAGVVVLSWFREEHGERPKEHLRKELDRDEALSVWEIVGGVKDGSLAGAFS